MGTHRAARSRAQRAVLARIEPVSGAAAGFATSSRATAGRRRRRRLRRLPEKGRRADGGFAGDTDTDRRAVGTPPLREREGPARSGPPQGQRQPRRERAGDPLAHPRQQVRHGARGSVRGQLPVDRACTPAPRAPADTTQRRDGPKARSGLPRRSAIRIAPAVAARVIAGPQPTLGASCSHDFTVPSGSSRSWDNSLVCGPRGFPARPPQGLGGDDGDRSRNSPWAGRRGRARSRRTLFPDLRRRPERRKSRRRRAIRPARPEAIGSRRAELAVRTDQSFLGDVSSILALAQHRMGNPERERRGLDHRSSNTSPVTGALGSRRRRTSCRRDHSQPPSHNQTPPGRVPVSFGRHISPGVTCRLHGRRPREL